MTKSAWILLLIFYLFITSSISLPLPSPIQQTFDLQLGLNAIDENFDLIQYGMYSTRSSLRLHKSNLYSLEDPVESRDTTDWVFYDPYHVKSKQLYGNKNIVSLFNLGVIDDTGDVYLDPTWYHSISIQQKMTRQQLGLTQINNSISSIYFVNATQITQHFSHLVHNTQVKSETVNFNVTGKLYFSMLNTFGTVQIFSYEYINYENRVELLQTFDSIEGELVSKMVPLNSFYDQLLVLTQSGKVFLLSVLEHSISALNTQQNWFNGTSPLVTDVTNFGVLQNADGIICKLNISNLDQCEFFYKATEVLFEAPVSKLASHFAINTQRQVFSMFHYYEPSGSCFLKYVNISTPVYTSYLRYDAAEVFTMSTGERMGIKDVNGIIYVWGKGRQYKLGDSQICDRWFAIDIFSQRNYIITMRLVGVIAGFLASLLVFAVVTLVCKKFGYTLPLIIVLVINIVFMTIIMQLALFERDRFYHFTSNPFSFRGGYGVFAIPSILALEMIVNVIAVILLIIRAVLLRLNIVPYRIVMALLVFLLYIAFAVWHCFALFYGSEHLTARFTALQNAFYIIDTIIIHVFVLAIIHLIHFKREEEEKYSSL